MLKGEVHDENAHALGGAPGHAGLFGTVDGVLGFALAMLQGSLLSPAMMDAVRTPQFGHRTCGWERAFAGWSGGDACSPDTIGHTGFTGTGLWIGAFDKQVWTAFTDSYDAANLARNIPDYTAKLVAALARDRMIAAPKTTN